MKYRRLQDYKQKEQDGEWEVKVSKKNQKSQKQRKREQAKKVMRAGNRVVEGTYIEDKVTGKKDVGH